MVVGWKENDWPLASSDWVVCEMLRMGWMQHKCEAGLAG